MSQDEIIAEVQRLLSLHPKANVLVHDEENQQYLRVISVELDEDGDIIVEVG